MRPPVERAGALAFAREVESALERGDTEFLDARFDIRGWLARGDPDRIEGAIAAFEELRRQGRGLGSIIVGSLDQLGASAQFLRIREREGKTTALFRLLGDETFAHLELLLVPDDAGRPAIEDVVFLAHGTRFSDAIVDPRDNGSVGRLRSLAGTGHHKEVLLGLAALPPSLQERGDVLLLRLEVARELAGVDYDDAAARIEAAAARRSGLEHLMYIVHHGREQHARCAGDLDALDRAVGGDPYLDVLRAQHRLIAEDLAGAASFAQAARTADPSLYEAHSTLLAVALRQGDHAQALELMTHIEEEFGDSFEDLAEAADFEGFRGSPQHAAWLERHVAEPPGPGAGAGEGR